MTAPSANTRHWPRGLALVGVLLYGAALGGFWGWYFGRQAGSAKGLTEAAAWLGACAGELEGGAR